jgi:DNA-directed RNA polymerase III subunit RPC5
MCVVVLSLTKLGIPRRQWPLVTGTSLHAQGRPSFTRCHGSRAFHQLPSEGPHPRPITVVVSKLEPKLEVFPVLEPDANPAPPLEVDVAVDAPRHRDGADEEDFVVREINVYFNPKPLQDHTK